MYLSNSVDYYRYDNKRLFRKTTKGNKNAEQLHPYCGSKFKSIVAVD